MMSSVNLLHYTLSAEEIALTFALINRPDLGKAILWETFGEISAQGVEERLKAASHSLLARGLAQISRNGIALLDEQLQSAVFPLCTFSGMLQIVLNIRASEEFLLLNVHLGREDMCTVHWTEQGVIHHIIYGKLDQIPEMIESMVSMPHVLEDRLLSRIQNAKHRILMESFAKIEGMTPKEGWAMLEKEYGWDVELAEAFLTDLHQFKKRGFVSYVDVNSENIEHHNLDEAVAGLYFLVGEQGWILTFPKGDEQWGILLPGTREVFLKSVRELLIQKAQAFVEEN